MRKADPNSIRAVMSGEATGPRAVLLRAGLRVVEPFYAGAMRTRNWLYNYGILTTESVGIPAIAFGNITTGGTGKTPLVRWAAEQLRDAGKSPAILSRGYGATPENPLGDELAMLDRQLNGVGAAPIPVLANPNRVDGATKLRSNHEHLGVILLDDAFQHRRVKRNLDILLINATEPFGFGHVLPRGLLREPLAGLRRADAIVLTHVNRVSKPKIANLESEIRQHAPTAPIYQTSHRLSLVQTPDGAAPLESLRTVKLFGFCGIGAPAAYERDISELGDCVGFHAFDDHHAYGAGDIAMLDAAAKRRGADVLLTTEKDWIKLTPLISKPREIPIWRVEMRIAFEGDHEARLLQQMLDAIKGANA